MNNRHIYLLAALLATLALSLFAYKAKVLGFPVVPQSQTQIWTIEAAVSFTPGPAAVKATLRIPALTPGYSLMDENFISRGFGVTTRPAPAGREAQWAVREASGEQTVYYRALVYRDPNRTAEDTTPPFPELPRLDQASRIAMERAGVQAGEVDIIVVSTATPDRLLPATACDIQARLGATHAAAFDISAACSGFIYALTVAEGYLAAGHGADHGTGPGR